MRFLLILLLVITVQARGKPGQSVPDPKRQAIIRRALIEHGYLPGNSWPETQQILREIARVHHWQHTHAPDARVLILLGLGNSYSNPAVLDMPPTQLEPGLLAEYKAKQ